MAKRHPITQCRADTLFGVWLIEQHRFESLFNHAMSFDLKDVMAYNQAFEESHSEPPVYQMVGHTAIIEASGVITKYPTSFRNLCGGSSCVEMITALRRARKDPMVKNAIIKFETPGGNAAGLAEVVDEMTRFKKEKPLYGAAEDECCSAGLLLASQCQYLISNRTALIGSLGTMLVLRDTSKAFKKEGIVVHAVTSGKFKATGAAGKEISSEELQYMQKLVDDVNEEFVNAVKVGRSLDDDHVRKLAADAKVYYAPEALEQKLIDEICPFEEFLNRVSQSSSPVTRSPKKVSDPKTATRRTCMLTAAQLQQLKKMPGGEQATEENADQLMLNMLADRDSQLTALSSEKTALTQKVQTLEAASPKLLDPVQAQGHLKLFHKEVDITLKSGTILPAQVDVIKQQTAYDEKTVAHRVLPDGTVLVPATTLMGVLELNKPNGLTQPATGKQPVQRTEPGNDKEAPKELTFERWNELRAANGQMPGTREEFDKRPRLPA